MGIVDNKRTSQKDKTNFVFTKDHTQLSKGIAILLMVYHHLFVVPDRIQYEFLSLPNMLGFDLQSVMANFCKICVCIFIFLSGVGLFYSLSKEKSVLVMYKKVGIHALKFMMNFWVIALLLFPVGLSLGFFNTTPNCIVNVFFGTFAPVAEWWFVRLYIVMLAVAPAIVSLLINKKNIIKQFLPIILVLCFYVTVRLAVKLFGLSADGIFFNYFFQIENYPCILPFIVGILCARFNVYSLLEKVKHTKLFCALMLLIAFAIRIVFSNNIMSMRVDFIVVPLFVFSVSTLLINTKAKNILCFFGKHSTNIWLTHTFWCYYFFQSVVMKPYVSILIYLWLLVLSVATSYLINLIYVPLSNLIFTKAHKLNFKGYSYFLHKQKQ